MSTFKVELVPVTPLEHPNADSLSIVRVFGYTCCVRTEQWDGIILGAYVPPDSIVDQNRPEFAFLKGEERPKYDDKVRVRVKRLRSIISQGILLPWEGEGKVGDDVAEQLGVTHYEPPIFEDEASNTTPPDLASGLTSYDVDHWRRFGAEVFEEGEQVLVTEKVHGMNARFVFTEGQMFAGSRTRWKIEDRKGNHWWKALEAHPEVEKFCRANPDVVVYGEVYGVTQDLRYGCKGGEIHIAVFDILIKNTWVDPMGARASYPELPWVPTVYDGPYNAEKMEKLSEGPSLILTADHTREGIIIKPMQERGDLTIGRVQLKIVSNKYLEKSK